MKSDAGIGVCELKQIEDVNKQSNETQSTPHSLSIFYGTQTGTAKISGLHGSGACYTYEHPFFRY